MEDRIEFDSVITEKALNDFKMYHVFHNVGGVFGYVFAAFAIVMCVLGVIFKMSPKYIVMMGLFGVFFFFYPIVNMRLGTKKQMKTVAAFKEHKHYNPYWNRNIKPAHRNNCNGKNMSAWHRIPFSIFNKQGLYIVFFIGSFRINTFSYN